MCEVAFTRDGLEQEEPTVLRLPPAGGGLFPEYDLARQARTMNLLAAAGRPTPSPAVHEDDPEWLGSDFIVMPLIPGRLPGDYVYAVDGWLHDAPPALQRRCYDAFADEVVALAGIDLGGLDTTFLHRPHGPGLRAEVAWWNAYLDWATHGDPPPEMVEAFAWAQATVPPDESLALTWGDARFANTVFDETGRVTGILDWEQAALGPIELDIGFWLATRRQASAAVGVRADPELPGFRSRDATIARFEARLGRALRDLDWHEAFAMVRMGTCTLGVKKVIRESGQDDHYLLDAPTLPSWTRRKIAAGTR
jgi:aminoglycoside phosphotransferase (APT) family kinase protein